MPLPTHSPQCRSLGFGAERRLGNWSPINCASDLGAVPCLNVECVVFAVLIFVALYDCLDDRLVALCSTQLYPVPITL
jgi:hypothetical protein